MIKWVAAGLGFLYFRFGGAVLGYFIGSMIEQLTGAQQNSPFSRPQGFSRLSQDEVELNLLSLAAIVIKADGKADSKELSFVRRYFIAQYGKNRAEGIFARFNSEIKGKRQDLNALCQFFVRGARAEVRVQILHFLFGIAQSDGSISASELTKLSKIAAALQLNTHAYESIKAMFVKSTDQAYTILEIAPDATDAEVKKAYRTLAKKYHPDKIVTDDPALKKGAEEKFQQVQTAYETIQKQRKI